MNVSYHRHIGIFLLALISAAPQMPVAHADGFHLPFLRRGDSEERSMKDLLRAAIDSAAFEAGQVNGYYHRPEMKIPIPESVKGIEKISKKFGGNLFWHDFEVSLNRVAEKTAPRAAVLMKEAVEDLKFEKNPRAILRENGSLTRYFRSKMETRLKDDFRREIERSVGSEEALSSYIELKNLYSSLPFVKNSDSVFALEEELSRRALDGIFSKIANEESRLRAAGER